MKEENVKVYEDVMGRKLSKRELIKIHKEATTPLEETYKRDWSRIVFRLSLAWLIGVVAWLLITEVLLK